MLDTGSEINIIREGFLPDDYIFDKTKIYRLEGIGNKPIYSIGIAKIKLLDYVLEIIVVSQDFPITQAGILGSEFFLSCNAIMNFGENSLEINGKRIPMLQGDDQVATGFLVSNVYNIENISLPTILVFNPPTESVERFLIDSGSEVNLISMKLIPNSEIINRRGRSMLRGINNEIFITLGTIEISVLGISTIFHAVPEDFRLPETGILGARFLTESKAIVDFKNKSLTVADHCKSLCFKHDSDTTSMIVNQFEETHVNPESTDSYEDFYMHSSLGMQHLYNISEEKMYEELDIDAPKNSKTIFEFQPTESPCIENLAETRINRILNLLRLDHLEDKEAEYVTQLVNEKHHVFYLPGDPLGSTSRVMHKIPTTNDQPINTKQYPLAHTLKQEAIKQVAKLLEDGVVRPSESPYNTPIWVVPKKPDSQGNPRWRMVLDFSDLNDVTIGDSYPLPNITEIFDQVGGAKYYTVLDLASGFHQIEMDPKDAHKTAFSTPFGHYEFKRMPFGLKNAPATFQRLMDNVLVGLQGQSLFVYLDDIVLYANSIEEHDKKFKELVTRLEDANLKLQIDKCEFLKRKVAYLGHVLSEKGLEPDPKKIEAVRMFPIPKTQKNVRQFLGLAGYYRRFIKDFAKIAKPLTALLQKDNAFYWNDETQQAFNALKDLLCEAPLLQFPDFSKPYNITTDASGYAVGGVLSQGEIGKDRPIAYTSRVLRGPELNYEVYEKEALAVIHSVRAFRTYVYGNPIKILTDHQPLVWFKKADLNTRVQKWRFKLSEYDYQIIYKPGKLNSNADALSRNPIESQVNVVTRRQKRVQDATKCPEIQNQPEVRQTEVNYDDKISNDKLKIDKKSTGEVPNEVNDNALFDDDEYVRKLRNKQKIDYAESESNDDDFEAEIKIPERYETPKVKKKNQLITRDEDLSNSEYSDCSSIGSNDGEIEGISDYEQENSEKDMKNNVNLDINVNLGNIIETREILHHRHDNIVYFVSINGEPCDKGAEGLIKNNKIPEKQNLVLCSINEFKRSGNKYYIGLCIKNEESVSQLITKDYIKTCLKLLHILLVKNNIKEFSIAKSEFIENIPWSEILELIMDIFSDTQIKIIVCKGTLQYVEGKDRDKIFLELHNSAIGGHRGVSKTFNRIRTYYYWENLKQDIQRRIQQCLECQLKKLVRLKTKQPMVITDTPGTVFDKIAMDIVGPLSRTKNNNEYILTMQDQLSKFCLAVPLQNTLASSVADAFIKKFICIFGAPRVILTDQGSNFLSSLMQRVAKRFRIKRVKTTAFHPQSNGSLERSHHALGEFLKQYTSVDSEWDEWVDIAMLNYNTCVQESTKHTPYEVIFGKLARLPSSDPLREGDLSPTYNNYIKELVTRLVGIRKIVYDNLVGSKIKNKKYYDKKINEQNFKVGDFVFLLKGPKPGKFGEHYSGPHKILEIINKNNIKIQFQKKFKIVHANRLRTSHILKETIKQTKKTKYKTTND